MTHPLVRTAIQWSVAQLQAPLYSKWRWETDGITLQFLDDRRLIANGRLADIGSGVGFWSLKASKRGAAEIWAIEDNPYSLKILRKKTKQLEKEKIIRTVEQDMYSGLDHILKGQFQAIHFGSSLYGEEEDVQRVLEEAYDLLVPRGCIVIKHPEKDADLYTRNMFGRFRPDHWGKRQINIIGDKMRFFAWKPYYKKEMEAICVAATGGKVFSLPCSTDAYHLHVIERSRSSIYSL